MNNTYRRGFFTSSQNHRLIAYERGKQLGFNAKGHTYIEEVFIERIIGRVIDAEIDVISTKWGSLMEIVLFQLLDLGWTMTHKQTDRHPKHKNYWSGTPDFVAVDKIAEAKCFYIKNFVKLSLCLLKQDIQIFKKEFPKEYWQCVSNAAIKDKNKAVIIAFMPTKKQLEKVIEDIINICEQNGLDIGKYYFIDRNDIESMPYLPEDSKLDNINMFEFVVPKEDLRLLESRIIKAEIEVQKLLKENEKILKA